MTANAPPFRYKLDTRTMLTYLCADVHLHLFMHMRTCVPTQVSLHRSTDTHFHACVCCTLEASGEEHAKTAA